MKAEEQGELLSALMDGELSELELRRLLASLDVQEAGYWSRWHLAQGLMQGRKDVCVVDAGFCARVHAAVTDTPAVPKQQWLHSFTRVAVAASVALALVGGWQLWQQQAAPLAGGAGTVAANHPVQPMRGMIATEDFPSALPSLSYSPQALVGGAQAQPVAESFSISREDYNRLMAARHAQSLEQAKAQAARSYVYRIDANQQGQR